MRYILIRYIVLIRCIVRRLGRIAGEILAHNVVQDHRELLRAHAIGGCPAARVESRSNVCFLAGLGGLGHV
jgi:hypothetical protein